MYSTVITMYDQLNTCTTKGLCEDTGFIVQICNQSMLSSSLVLIDEKNAFVINDAAKKVYFNNTNCNVCSIKLTTHLNYSIMNIALLQPTAICYNTHIL